MTEWIPGAIALVALLILGVLIPYGISELTDTGEIAYNNFTAPISGYIDNGSTMNVTLPFLGSFEVVFNPVDTLTPDNYEPRMIENVRSLGVFPTAVLFPISLLIFLGLLYSFLAYIALIWERFSFGG